MASRIITKKGSGAPLASDLVHGELAVDTVNKRLYTENAGGTIIELGTSPSTIDINAGTIDGTVIGGSSAAAGSFTTISASGEIAANGGVAFGDNDKATFGASDDLQIYHDGSNSYISDQGTGDLNVLANKFLVKSASGGSTLIQADPTATNVQLFFGNAAKLATTATGIDVTGTVTADGLTVDGGSSEIKFSETASSNASLVLQDATERLSKIQLDITSPNVSTDYYAQGKSGGWSGRHRFYTSANNTTAVNRMEIGSNGDISFYEDTGTTAKFYWDASAESLGIGTSSPASKLDVRGGNLYVDGGGISGSAQVLASFSASSGANFGQISNTGTRWSLGYGGALSTVGTEVLSWNSSGNVGIGTTSPAAKLEIGGAGEGIILASPDGTRYKITVANGGILIVTAV